MRAAAPGAGREAGQTACKECNMAIDVHDTAIVDPRAMLEDGVSIGPYSVIGPDVSIGAGTRIRNHVTIEGRVRIGRENDIFPCCVIGAPPQDIGYRDQPTSIEIGDHNVIREAVTIHRATDKEEGVTRVGSDNFIMGSCHVAHDVNLGSHVTMANTTLLGGHVHVQDHAALSGMIAVHHFATIGQYAFVGGMSRIPTDVPPFMLLEGNPVVVRCVNLVGLRRHGFSSDEIRSLGEAHRLLYRVKMHHAQAWELLEGQNRLTGPVRTLFEFLAAQRQGRLGRARERLRAA
jgi:UDP-N-acetylglucosamine acyltransferase